MVSSPGVTTQRLGQDLVDFEKVIDRYKVVFDIPRHWREYYISRLIEILTKHSRRDDWLWLPWLENDDEKELALLTDRVLGSGICIHGLLLDAECSFANWQEQEMAAIKSVEKVLQALLPAETPRIKFYYDGDINRRLAYIALAEVEIASNGVRIIGLFQ